MKFIPCPRRPDRGFWIPDADITAKQKFGMNASAWDDDYLPVHQKKQQTEALKHVKNFRVAFDLGAHVGYWSMRLSKKFEKVYAFEQVPTNFECLAKNSGGNVIIHNYALGNEYKSVHVGGNEWSSVKARVGGDSGDKGFKQCACGRIPMVPLDHFKYDNELEHIDFMKIDCEDYDYYVILGGEKTIKKHKPVIIVEQVKGRNGWYGLEPMAAYNLLKDWDYKEVANIDNHDYVMVCDE